MTTKGKVLLLIFCTVGAFVITLMLKPIPQNPAYHQFADQRRFLGIPNFFNVISNLPFLFIGAYGLKKIKSSTAPAPVRRMYRVLFVAICLTALGSAFYHYRPDNHLLVYDRIPMTLVFMAFLASVIAAWIDMKAGARLLVPLLLLGICSVIYWSYSEWKGLGDVRFYGFIQFFPILIIPLIILLFRNPENSKGLSMLAWVMGWYMVAKLFEIFDKSIYAFANVISGHSLKHIAAVVATWYIVQFFTIKYVDMNIKAPSASFHKSAL